MREYRCRKGRRMGSRRFEMEDQGMRGRPLKEIVLEDDIKTQELLIKEFKNKLPDIKCFSEELENLNELEKEDSIKLLIDPLDGTHNFYFGQPNWAIMISILMWSY